MRTTVSISDELLTAAKRRALGDEADASGDLVPNVVLAAIAVEHHCRVVTLDRDFAGFSSVQHVRPAS